MQFPYEVEFYEYQKLMSQLDAESVQGILQDPEYINKATTLVISFHNVAAEEEYFQNFESAFLHYENSVNSSQQYLGADHRITQQFAEDFAQYQNRQQVLKQNQQNLQNSPQSTKKVDKKASDFKNDQ